MHRHVLSLTAPPRSAYDSTEAKLGSYLTSQNFLLENDNESSIKCDNIFLNDGVVKLGDFGFNRELKEGDYATTICGTIETMAPEVL